MLAALGATLFPEPPPPAPPFGPRLERISAVRDDLSRRLATALDTLRCEVEAHRPDLLAQLEPEPPAPVPSGYGILPVLRPDQPEADSAEPWENRYSLVDLEAWSGREQAEIDRLEERLGPRPVALDDLVEAYALRAENFRRLDAHLGYHAFWQGEVEKWPAFWARKNALLDHYRAWRDPRGESAADRAEAGRRALERVFFALSPHPALCIRRGADGGREIELALATDIADEAFLAALASGVERFWNQAPPMVDAGLSIVLAWQRRSPRELYPEGAPPPGSEIDLTAHRRRFGDAPFVLTTGARSTHVVDFAVLLDGAPTELRTLCHELGHLLGFDDQYLRAYEGSPRDPDGVVFIEVSPFPGSLMASPGRGRVTPAMVAALLDAYGGHGDAVGSPP